VDPANRIRLFLNASSRLSRGFTLSGEDTAFSLQFTFNEGSLESSFEETAALARYATLLRPFIADSSPTELRAFCEFLEDAEIVDVRSRDEISTALETADKRLYVNMIVNGRALSAREIYFAYAEGHLFDDNADAKRLLESLGSGPIRHLVQFLFHSACLQYAQVVFMVRDALISAMEDARWIAGEATAGQCIYCLAETNGMEPVEHVIPEAFGVDELVLQGCVCGACNNSLSRLDQDLADSEALSLLRVINVPLTKKAKFPRAEFSEFELLKMKPRELVFRSKTGRDPFETEDLGDGHIRFKVKARGKRSFNPASLARSLFKIGLGLVAHDAGPEAACHPRYNAARAFIRGGATFPNHLVMSTTVKPDSAITAAWDEVGDVTWVALTIYGVVLAFNLQPTPFGVPDDAHNLPLTNHWLGGGSRDDRAPREQAQRSARPAMPLRSSSLGQPTATRTSVSNVGTRSLPWPALITSAAPSGRVSATRSPFAYQFRLHRIAGG